MSKEATLTLAYILAYILQASCAKMRAIKPKRCEVHLRVEVGWVCGRVLFAEDGTRYGSFRGIPYAEPPLGNKRFQELQPLEPWEQGFLLDATLNPPACPQSDLFFGRMSLHLNGMSEDCIYLNLHVPYKYLPRSPTVSKARGLPILVFIHGGAFQSGAGLTDILGPQYLMLKNIIVITFNYRLNVFGFYSLNTKEIPGNQGLRDMVTCLRWVQQNAYTFGGDPRNVTLMGHSAGATAAHILSLSKVTKGLFQRIILASGTAVPSYYTTSPEYAAQISNMFLRMLGINATDPVLIHEELTKMPLLKLMNANSVLQFNTGIVSFNPVVETDFPGITRIIEKDPITLISEGRGNEYPALISYTDNEAASLRWFMVDKHVVQNVQQDNRTLIAPRLIYSLDDIAVDDITTKVHQRYFSSNYTLLSLTRYFTDMIFKHPALKVAEWRASMGAAPTYMYQFAYSPIFSPVKNAHWIDYSGSAHMDDLSFVFRVNSMLKNNNFFHPPENADENMKRWMVFLITNFMSCSRPICNNSEVWPPVGRDAISYNLINTPMIVQMTPISDYERDVVTFFDSIDPDSQQISLSARHFTSTTESEPIFSSTASPTEPTTRSSGLPFLSRTTTEDSLPFLTQQSGLPFLSRTTTKDSLPFHTQESGRLPFLKPMEI